MIYLCTQKYVNAYKHLFYYNESFYCVIDRFVDKFYRIEIFDKFGERYNFDIVPNFEYTLPETYNILDAGYNLKYLQNIVEQKIFEKL